MEHTESVIDPEVVDKVDITEPNFWKVIMHNDNRTTMDFVVALLVQVFSKSAEEATRIMLQIHTQERAVVGRYTHEVAEDKMNICHTAADRAGFPLRVSIEEDK